MSYLTLDRALHEKTVRSLLHFFAVYFGQNEAVKESDREPLLIHLRGHSLLLPSAGDKYLMTEMRTSLPSIQFAVTLLHPNS